MTGPSRRQMFKGAAAAASAWAPWAHGAPSVSGPIRIDAARLRQTLEALSLFGRPAGGTFADGVSRFAYSDADLAGRAFVTNLLKDVGLSAHIDAAGNIRARREGEAPRLKPLMIGSHIDSVPGGGNFDGALGSMAAIEVAWTLKDHRIALRHPLELVFWSNEEGGTIGSLAAAGELKPEALDLTLNGVRRRDGIRRIGGDPDHIDRARIAKGSLAAYLELHIEQSGRLEQAGVNIGVVDGIVAIDEYEVEITGVANHAGTTPMPERRNALLAAARLIEAVQEEATRDPGRQVGTVGHLEVFPNVRNVIPGRVRHTLELRDLDPRKIRAIGERIRARAAAIAADTHTDIVLRLVEHDEPAIASPNVQAAIEDAARALGLSTMHLPSGAGHDASPMATLAPMGMIFAPSVAGVSHSPRELTRWEDCANGADVLLGALLRLDRSL